MKKILSIILILVLLSSTLFANVTVASGENGIGNSCNGGYATSDGEYVYYCADKHLYRENIGGGNRKSLLSGASFEGLTVHNNYLYFMRGSSINRIDIDGQKAEERVTYGDSYIIHDDYMYVSERSYSSMDILKYRVGDWNTKKIIIEEANISGFVIIDNKIYFDNKNVNLGSNGLASADLNGGNFKSYLVGKVSYIFGDYDDMIYFTQDGKVKRMAKDGHVEVLEEINSSYYPIIYNGYIFSSEYNNGVYTLTRYSVHNLKKEISDLVVKGGFCIAGDKLYRRSPDDYAKVEIFDLPNFVSGNHSDIDTPNKDTATTSFGSNVSNWAKTEVEDAYDDGLVPETLVGKDLTQKINRSEFAAVAVLIYENLTNKSVSASSTPFTDIKNDANKKAINKAYKLGITVGTTSTTFDPSRNITREELATMLCRGIKKYKFPDWTPETDYMYYIQGTSGKKFADDAEISDYAKNSVYFMSSAGIIKGVDSTHFAPKASVTRGDAIDYGMATREQAIIMAKRIKENKSYFDDI